MVRASVLSYESEESIMIDFGFKDKKQTKAMCEPYYRERAQMLIDKLSPLSTEIPSVIKIAIWKLSIVNFTAKRLHPKNIDELTHQEKVENLTIKAKFLDPSTWEGLVFEETNDAVTPEWVMVVEDAHLSELVTMAKTLSEKILLRKEVPVGYHNWESHVERCVKMEIDPKKYSEAEAIDMEKLINEYKS